jgi:putative transposase
MVQSFATRVLVTCRGIGWLAQTPPADTSPCSATPRPFPIKSQTPKTFALGSGPSLVYKALFMRPSLGFRSNLTKVGLMAFYDFRPLLTSFLQHDGLPFADVLPEQTIQQTFADAGVPYRQDDPDDPTVYTPAVTLWAFLSQVLFKKEQRSCLAAVSRVVVLCVALGREPCSDNTGAYCRARARLPLAIVQSLTRQIADQCEEQVPAAWLWRERHVHLIDGTTVSMPDTTANQAAYPQPSTQAEGLGFPMIRMVLLLSLATAMVQDIALGPYAGKETGEPALLRQLLARFQPGDVLLGDRYFCSYFMIALLREVGVDFVARLHQRRDYDFRRGQRLGAGDHIVRWTRPVRPDWMDQATYERMPLTLEMREIYVQVNEPGFRVASLVVVTTLTDAERYTRDDVSELYRQRWLVELDIRAIKISLDMDVLRCQTPEMVRKEIWTCLLAYNLIRQSLLQAALLAGRSPRQLSFTAALQKMGASCVTIVTMETERAVTLIEAHLSHLANQLVGDRPDRVEPRAIKRRPKAHQLLQQPRAAARAALLAGAAAD